MLAVIIKMYSQNDNRDSFDRFGDDLCELILSFLLIMDALLLQSVSKQWRNTIFNRQTKLQLNPHTNQLANHQNSAFNEISKRLFKNSFSCVSVSKCLLQCMRPSINKHAFQSLLKKCRNITDIKLNYCCDCDDLQLIGKYLVDLRSLECDIECFSESGLIAFAKTCGHRLKQLNIRHNKQFDDSMLTFLRLCPNIVKISSDHYSPVIPNDIHFLPKLENISIKFQSENIDHMRIIADKYSSQLKAISVFTSNLSTNQIKTILFNISTLSLLQKLQLNLHLSETKSLKQIVDSIELVAHKCTQIKHLDFGINITIANLFNSLSMFKSIKTLTFYTDNYGIINKSLNENCEQLNNCFELKRFKLYCFLITDSFFNDIDIHFANISHIDINTNSQLNDNTLFKVSKLKYLKVFGLTQNRLKNDGITDNGICALIKSCLDIENFSFDFRPYITYITINALIALALKLPKRVISFRFNSVENENETIKIDNFVLPNNLKITVKAVN